MAKKKQVENTNNILIGLAIVLIVFSTLQAFQIDDIKDEIELNNALGGVSSASSRTNTGAQGATKAPQSAPTMVGGCWWWKK